VLRGGEVLIDRRPPGGLLGGLWEFPRVELDDGDDASALAAGLRCDLRLDVEPSRGLGEVHHAYSHFKVTLLPWLCDCEGGKAGRAADRPTRWVSPSELSGFPMSTADRKVMRALLDALG
jgi:A/G-specific adenine glycosylase